MRPQQMISSPILPLQPHFSTTTIAIFTIFLIFPTSNGVYGQCEKCSHLASCGNISRIGYPFWGDGLRPQYCGHPYFKLDCRDDYPILTLGEDDYQVLNMTTNFTITLKLHHHKPDSKNCLFSAIAKYLNDSLFNHSPSSPSTISLFECLNPIKGDYDSFPCHDNHGHSAFYYSQPTSSDQKSDYQSCNFIQVPQGNGTPENLYDIEFKIDFSMEKLEACLHCQNSGGICGSSDDYSPLCLCKDQDQHYPDAYPQPDQHPGPDSSAHKQGKWKRTLAIALPAALVFLTALIAGFFWCKKRKFQPQTMLSRTMSDGRMRSDLEIGNSFFGIPVFSYTELQQATNNFDPNRILGDGGFGIVYLGKLRDGREVAVKRLYERNYKKVGQFMTEVEILTRLKHPNLVTLYGCTSRHSRELLLVYEYIPNGTVADHLYGDRAESTSLTWAVRMRIALETAGALSYLHASDVIHRDVKTNNILLDSNFSVKLADFGLSRFFPLDVTHVSTAPQGTPGYLDPEYRKCYQVTNKSDVYSLGVVLVELISSMPAVDIDRNEDEINLSTYAMNKIRLGALDELVDQKLGFESDFKVKRMVTLVAELAFRCLQQEKDIRPSMEEVLEALKRIESLNYEALEAEEISRGSAILKPASGAAESEVEQPSRNPENPNSSPKSVIEGWASRSSVSNTSG